MRNSSPVCFLSGLCSDLPAAPGAAAAVEAELPAAPRSCGTSWGARGSTASSGALGATWRSVLPPEVGRRCVGTFRQPSAWCRADGHCRPSSVEPPARPCLLLTGMVAFLAQPHVVVPTVSAEKEPGAHQMQAGFAGHVFFATSIALAGCQAYRVLPPNN